MKSRIIRIVTSFLLMISALPSFASVTSKYQLPIVLIHAFPTDQRMWAPQQAAFNSIITIDLKGFGHAAMTNGNAVTMKQYADQVKQHLDNLHVKKIILGGESMGGYIALTFLKYYPDYVEGLILSNTQSIADSAETKAKREALAKNILAEGTNVVINDFMTKAFTKDADGETRSYLYQILIEQNAAGMASALRGMALREDTSEVLKHTKIPVLILTSDGDVVISPQQSHNMNKLAKNSKLVVIKNAGHLSNLEQPQQWNDALQSFLSGL